MPLPRNRSNSMRKIFRKTPQGNAVAFRRRKKGGRHACAVCGSLLQGVSSSRSSAASRKTPTRKFGGHLCHACAAKAISYSARLAEGAIAPKDVEVSLKRYVV